MTGGEGASKKRRVGRMFDAIAPTYDALNHLLSLGIDRGWRRKMVRMVDRSLPSVKTDGNDNKEFSSRRRVNSPEVCPESPFRILDVATGTGDLAIGLARRIPKTRVVGVDISEGMLRRGREKISRRGLADRIVLRRGDAEALEFADGDFDVVTVAFGVRNFGDIAAGLGEMARVLRPGGRCFVLEFSEPTVPFFGAVYGFYFHRVLPWMGRLVSRDSDAYSYLPRSVGAFPAPERFSAMLLEAGFTGVHVRRLTFGIAYIYEASKR